MDALIVSDSTAINEKVRQCVVRAGFGCGEEDAAPLSRAGFRAGVADYDVAILVMGSDHRSALSVLREIHSVTDAALLVVGPASDPQFILGVLREGADQFLDEHNIEAELEEALVRVKVKRTTSSSDGPMIAVLGSCGGAGASTIAANLGAVMAKQARRTLLCDMRLSSGDLAVLLDLDPTYTVADLCQHHERMDQTMLRQSLVRHSDHLHLLAAPTDLRGATDVSSQGIRRVLGVARTLFSHVVVDLDRTFAQEQLVILGQADVILLVVRGDMVSLHNASKTLSLMQELGVPESRIHGVVNRAGQAKELRSRRVENALGIRFFESIPNDPPRINWSNNRGTPIVLERANAKVSRSLMSLADALSSEPRRPIFGADLGRVNGRKPRRREGIGHGGLLETLPEGTPVSRTVEKE